MSYSETVNEKTGDVARSEYKTAEKRGDKKEIRSKDETYTAREKKKVDYEKKGEAKKKESDRKTQDQEKKDSRSRDRKCEEKKYDEKTAVNKKPESKQKAQDTKHRERKTSDGHKEKQNDPKPKNENSGRRNERKNDERKNSDDAKRNEKGQTQVGCVTKALESINVSPVALLVSKMIDQQSLVVKLLTEAREKESRKLELLDRGEKCDEILRMKEKVRLLERQLRSLEITLEQKVDRFDRFDSITKTESTQTQQYGIDNATNTGVHAEPVEAKDVGIRITNAARQRHTCTIF